MSLHQHPIEEIVTLPDGRDLLVRVGIAQDSYIAERDLDTVDVELFEGGTLVATVNTVLSAADDEQANALARDLIAGLGSGEIEPTAAAIEPLAERAT